MLSMSLPFYYFYILDAPNLCNSRTKAWPRYKRLSLIKTEIINPLSFRTKMIIHSHFNHVQLLFCNSRKPKTSYPSAHIF